MGYFFNQPLGNGKWLFSVLMIMTMGISTGSHSPLGGVERASASPPAQHLRISPKKPLSTHNLRTEVPIHSITAYRSSDLNRCFPEAILGTILISWAALSHDNIISWGGLLSGRFPQMADGIHFVFGRHNHGSLEASQETAKSSILCGWLSTFFGQSRGSRCHKGSPWGSQTWRRLPENCGKIAPKKHSTRLSPYLTTCPLTCLPEIKLISGH